MPTVVLTRPTSAGIPGTIITGVVIPPLTTVVVDTLISNDNLSLKWIYTIMDSVDQDVASAEVLANHRYGSDPRHNIYARVGPSMPHRVDVQVSGSDLELHIRNNHTTNTYTANIVRIQLLA